MNMENLEDYDNNITNAYTELNLADHWKNLTLEQEIFKGALLRHEKSRRNCYDYFNDKVFRDLNEPSTSKPRQFDQTYGRTPPCKSRKVQRKKSPKRCPIRIAELAVPTKRQCIETWRYKSRVLPNFMVDRLKQRVMDERPIVHIHDAINCFKKKKKRTKLRSHKKSRTIVENDRMKEIRMLCAIFGYKIILKLLRPLNISLNPCLERINRIVKEEIHEVLRCKNISNQKQGKNNEHLDEISRKITLWAVNILEETDNKLLEEELRELEEEEGPVLDLIDNLIERVMDICELPYYESTNNADEKTESEHIISSVKISKETVADLTEDSEIVSGKEKGHLDEFERALKEDYKNALNYTKGTSESMNGNEFLQGDFIYEDDDSQYISEHFRTEVQIIIDEILCSAIAVKLQLEEEKDRNSQLGLTFVTEPNIGLDNNIYINKNKKSPELESYFSNGNSDKDHSIEKIFIAHDDNELGNASENKYLPEVTSDTDFEKDDKNIPPKALDSNSVILKNKNELENGIGSALLNKMKSNFNVKENDKNGSFVLDALDSNSETRKNKNQLEDDTELLSELKSNLDNEVKELFTIDSKAHAYSNIDTEKDDEENLKQNQIELNTGNNETANNKNVQPHEELNNITERNVIITENIVSNQEGEDNITEEDKITKNEDLTSSPQSSEQKQTTDDIADTRLEKLTEEPAEDVNEEDKNKKVKFSDTDMDIGNKTQLITKFSSQILVQIPSSNYIMQNIDFAPPNPQLLSNVDESWPEDMPIPTFKLTESVNKSVTSLGNIFEADEKKELSSENSYDFTRNSEIIMNVSPFTLMSIDIAEIEEVSHAQFHKDSEIEEKLSATIKETDFQANEDQKQFIVDRENETDKVKSKRSQVQGKYSKQPSDIKTNTSYDKTKNEKKPRNISNNKLKGTGRVNIPKKYEYLPVKIDDTSIKKPSKIHKQSNDRRQNFTITNSSIKRKFNNKVNDNRMVKTNSIDIENNLKALKEGIEFQDNQPKQKTKDSPNAIVELHQKISINYEYWKPNPYSCQNTDRRVKTNNSYFQQRGRSDDYDIQNWCKNLESVIENLELWNTWIYTACKCIEYLSEKGKIKHSRSTEMVKTKWMTLRKYITEDRILWKDIKRRNRDGLKSYKKYYNNNKIGRTANSQIRCNCSDI